MQIILKTPEDFKNLPDNLLPAYKPDSFPCLAVGTFRSLHNVPDGYEYEFVSLREINLDGTAEYVIVLP